MTGTRTPLYDEQAGLRDIARARLERDELTRRQTEIADRLAVHMERHFSPEETETAGRALLIGTASCSALAQDGIPATVVMNILAFAAGRLIGDGRDWLTAQGGDS